MASLMTHTLQTLFFPKIRIRPKDSWKQDLAAFGSVTSFKVQRGKKGHLSCLKVSRGNSDKVVVFAHPISRRGKYFYAKGERISVYLDQGYDVVLFDFNGFGESDRVDLLYWRDAQAVIEHCKAAFKPMHMVLHGLSFGSYHIIRAIPSLPKDSGVVLENTSRSLYDYWKKWFVTGNIARVFESLPFQFVKDMRVIEVFEGMGRPDIKFYCVACEEDHFTPEDEMADLIAHIRSPKTYEVYKGAKHFEAPVVNRAQYTSGIQAITH